ncbi:hypothetical protein PTSG_12332 [Salpingoeca rosetta]|uniref:DNRLRE domain-containing protein n=1 Tax=Salpingoeca rosetta (strain ATCC 50818 / BSB-021) TaxID=946362 RepID=F2UBF5_SALR5|nr:uncharacterized protein PTSG_12332 [Salpingoeca rosetta]EGD73821.1 hypothetical protein PTSG_12332 [Salpingoeca rosetta]|eukprot:XP_004993384.1 hypothetical protein PTSG_12332 [Salpingoeca rosetta]
MCSDNLEGSIGVGHIIAGATAGNGVRRGLLYFNLTGAPFEPTKLTSATLTLKPYRAGSGSDSSTFSLWRLQKHWTTGNSTSASGRCATAMAGDVTWKYNSFNVQTWDHLGGDFAQTSSSQSTITPSKLVFDVTTDVKSWLSQTAPNHGWVLQGEENKSSTAVLFYSSESFNGPYLTFNMKE